MLIKQITWHREKKITVAVAAVVGKDIHQAGVAHVEVIVVILAKNVATVLTKQTVGITLEAVVEANAKVQKVLVIVGTEVMGVVSLKIVARANIHPKVEVRVGLEPINIVVREVEAIVQQEIVVVDILLIK